MSRINCRQLQGFVIVLGTPPLSKFPRQIADATNYAYRFRDVVEACFVVLVVMICIVFALRQFETVITKTRVAEALSLIAAYRADVTAFRAQTGRWPETEAEKRPVSLDWGPEGLSYVIESMDILDDGVVVARFRRDAYEADALRGLHLAFRPAVNPSDPTAPLTWTCGYWRPPGALVAGDDNLTDIPESLLPFTCRRLGGS